MNKPSILVVEDDVPVRCLITTTLKTHGYKYLTKSGSQGAAIVVVILHGVVIVQGGNRIEQGCQQIRLGVADLGTVIRDPLQNPFQVHHGELGETFLNIGGRVFRIPANTDRRTSVHGNLQHDLHQLVHLF